jgi:hypothetical protein
MWARGGGGGFVVAVFLAGQLGLGGDEFAAEGFGEDRLGDLISAGGVFAANDLVLLVERRTLSRHALTYVG